MLTVIKKIYRSIIPFTIRRLPIIHKIKAIILRHEWIYDSEYYEDCVDGAAISSSSVMVLSIFKEFSPKSVVDVGCGTGALLVGFRDYGCDTFGLEYSPAGIALCKKRGLNVKRFDLENEDYECSSSLSDLGFLDPKMTFLPST
jgi:SAM-dependent methyltransferase